MDSPDILSGLYSDDSTAVNALGTAINKATGALGCPTLNAINNGQFSGDFAQYPATWIHEAFIHGDLLTRAIDKSDYGSMAL